MSRRRFPVWTLIGVVLVVALIAGSGVLSSTAPTAAERAASIESVIRCPSCEDLSVASSSAPTAVAVRATVRELVGEGRTDAQVEQYLEARYGSTIVLDPPASGWSLLVWVLPVACGLLAAVTLTVVLVRRRRIGDADGDGPVAGDLDPTVVREERRQFIARSLADADARSSSPGDLTDRGLPPCCVKARHAPISPLERRRRRPGRAGCPVAQRGRSLRPGPLRELARSSERPWRWRLQSVRGRRPRPRRSPSP